MIGSILTVSVGVIGGADGPTSILFSGSPSTGYIVAAVVVVLLAILLIRRARQSGSGEEPARDVIVTSAASAAPALEDEELIAVLTAAILMMEQSSGGQKLVIRDIRYVGTEGSAWAAAGRRDLMSQRNGRNHS